MSKMNDARLELAYNELKESVENNLLDNSFRVRISEADTVDISVLSEGSYVMKISIWAKGTTAVGSSIVSETNRFVEVLQGEPGDSLYFKFRAMMKRMYEDQWEMVDIPKNLEVLLVSEGYDV